MRAVVFFIMNQAQSVMAWNVSRSVALSLQKTHNSFLHYSYDISWRYWTVKPRYIRVILEEKDMNKVDKRVAIRENETTKATNKNQRPKLTSINLTSGALKTPRITQDERKNLPLPKNWVEFNPSCVFWRVFRPTFEVSFEVLPENRAISRVFSLWRHRFV